MFENSLCTKIINFYYFNIIYNASKNELNTDYWLLRNSYFSLLPELKLTKNVLIEGIDTLITN